MIIGISGRKRSGKDTVGQMFYKQGFRRKAFAQPIKDVLYTLNPIVESLGESDSLTVRDVVDSIGYEEGKDRYPEIRRLLQVMGKEIGRDMFYENVWIDMAFMDIDSFDDVVFTDVRFPNEAEAIRARGGKVFRVYRPSVLDGHDLHPSETALDDYEFDAYIENSGSIDELEDEVNLLFTNEGLGLRVNG